MKKGFTLIELLVYMVIMGFIIVVAGRVFSDATGMRVRTQNMTKASEEANKIAEIIKEDLSQMGAKVWKDLSATNDPIFETVKGVYIDINNDSSSFNLKQENGYSNIEFKKISYDKEGKYLGVNSITWYVDNETLYRSCETKEGLGSNDCPAAAAASASSSASASEAKPVAMAENVKTFILNPSKPSSDASFNFGGAPSTSNPAPTFSFISHYESGSNFYTTGRDQPTQDNSNTATLEFSERNENSSGKKQHQVYLAAPNTSNSATINSCKTFDFTKGETYAIKFKTPNNSDNSVIAIFQPGVDHMAVSFRNTSGGEVLGMPKNFMFYPAQDNTASSINQYFEFSVPADVSDVCVVLTFAFYSGTSEFGPHQGKLRIKDFELLRKQDGKYEFVRNDVGTFLTSENKKNVKAFELILEVEKGREIGSTRKEQNENEKDEDVGYIIPVPNNGIVPSGS